MDRTAYLDRSRTRGVNPIVYWLARAILQPFFHVYFRMSRIGREHIPTEGAFIVAANHRSFIDPFLIATLARRPIYFVAKTELFSHRASAWFLSSLGAFPINRGYGDESAMGTARDLLDRGEGVLIFPEGTRTRPGGLGTPHRGVGRLALETGAPVIPVAIMGTDTIRRGWRIRPHKVRMRAGRALHFPQVEKPTRELAVAATERIWPRVALQWEWLGGMPALKRAVVIGAGAWGTGVAVALERAGLRVELGCRTTGQADAINDAEDQVNVRYLPGVALPDGLAVGSAEGAAVEEADLVVLAVPSRALPAAMAAHGARIQPRAGVLVLAKGLVAPEGETPCSYVAARTTARSVACLGGPGHAAEALEGGASLIVGAAEAGFGRQLVELLHAAGFAAEHTDDVVGVELAGTAKNAAVLAASAAAPAGPNAAGAAAGKVFAEVDRYAQRLGARSETFSGLAGAGDLVAGCLATSSRNRQAGELLALGVPAAEIEPRLGHAAEGLAVLPLLAVALRREGVPAPAVGGLAAVIDGRVDAARWAQGVLAPGRPARRRAA